MGWSLVSDGFRLLMAGVDFDSADDEEAFLAGALETAHAEVMWRGAGGGWWRVVALMMAVMMAEDGSRRMADGRGHVALRLQSGHADCNLGT